MCSEAVPSQATGLSASMAGRPAKGAFVAVKPLTAALKASALVIFETVDQDVGRGQHSLAHACAHSVAAVHTETNHPVPAAGHYGRLAGGGDKKGAYCYDTE